MRSVGFLRYFEKNINLLLKNIQDIYRGTFLNSLVGYEAAECPLFSVLCSRPRHSVDSQKDSMGREYEIKVKRSIVQRQLAVIYNRLLAKTSICDIPNYINK